MSVLFFFESSISRLLVTLDVLFPGCNSNKYVLDPTERKNNALTALKLLCESPALEPHLLELLSAKDSQSQTPFMLAVSLRAYPAASVILDAIQIVAGKQSETEGSLVA